MAEYALKLDKVTKVFKLNSKLGSGQAFGNRLVAVDNCSLEVAKGEIFGLLGPNGAGKSTIIKMICGLVIPTQGDIYVGEEKVSVNNERARQKLGALIETPVFYNNWSCWDNLRYLADLQGGVSDQRIRDIIQLVELENRVKDRLSTYSMGMLQKVGIAQAIMHKPDLLILDEPTNGLDPQWIVKIRMLIKRLAKEYGMTVIVSSHILAEMQEICDRVAILDKGKLVCVNTIDEIMSETKDGGTNLELKVDIESLAIQIISQLGYKYYKDNDKLIVHTSGDISEITKELVLGGVMIKDINIRKKKLEDAYNDLVATRVKQEENIFGQFYPVDENSNVSDSVKTSDFDAVDNENLNAQTDISETKTSDKDGEDNE